MGLPARSCWLGYGERARAGRRFNTMVAGGEIAPIVIGSDHLDSGLLARPTYDTAAMRDGSDAVLDWSLLNQRERVLEMKKSIPAWAMRKAQAEDYGAVQDAHSRGTMQIKWPDRKALRHWARSHAWPTPWFRFEPAILAKLLESQTSFAQAIDESGIEIHIPQREYILSAEKLEGLDSQYASRGATWAFLVEELREIRRAVEAGVAVQVEDGPRLQSWEEFYRWAHGRYPLLEEGYDKWIGDDH